MTDLVVSRPDGNITKPLSLKDAEDAVRSQARKYGANSDGYRLKIRGEEFSRVRRSLSETMERWEALARANDRVGDVIVLDLIDHPYTILARTVADPAPHIPNTVGNDDIDQIKGAWDAEYPHSRNAGICVYKTTGGVPSQHCNWQDNDQVPGDGADASDEFLSDMAEMKDAAGWLVSQYKRFVASHGDDGLPCGRVIIDHSIWDPFQGWHGYSGEQHFHDHWEGRWWLIHGFARSC